MLKPTVIHSTFVIERTYPHAQERVFAAFADENKLRQWLAEGYNNTVEEFSSDFREGGAQRLAWTMSKETPFPGVALCNVGSYLDIVPGKRIVTAMAMALGERRISAALVTYELMAAEGGTDLVCTFQGAFFEGSDGPEMRRGGFEKLLERLGEVLGS